MYHQPVLLAETLELLDLRPGEQVIDATLGDGGHSEAMLRIIGPTGRLLGFDASPLSLARARERLGQDDRVTFVHANFSDLSTVAEAHGFVDVDAILFDLGVASWQLDEPALGLSFQRSEPLDMRLNPELQRTAADIVNRSTPEELMTILETYGDIRRAKSLVERIREGRSQSPIQTTDALVSLIGSREPRVLAPIFQALRIAVNHELTILPDAVGQAIDQLAPGGRLVVMSYHSGEDRVIKRAFLQAAADGRARILTRHLVVASPDEQRQNARSRSAKLRAIETTANEGDR